ncbi:gamma-butyrobetaine dioxygenase-like isoform X1 [Stegodyphus dumicola]|uniref:gamma-butyrobetaine dioxygenase-like isoform X1 n=1 Tax=Stegodyphus dumicola TaxID=202533 RepID=UPI0015AAB7DB|nr:gamma-butyrobetaine dioxygenase-like isoform X1 [Stegodyphus dumicola]
MMRLKSLCSLYQFGARQSFRGLVKPTNMKIKLLRDIHKTGYRTRATAAINPNFQPVCITKTFPTSHQSLKIGFEDNLASDFQYIWLRDNCQCEKCIHPVSRQKMLDTVSLNINIKPKSYHLTENGKLKIVWPDGDGEHVSFYDPQWLHKYGKGFELDSYDYVHDSLPPMVTWNGETIKKIMPEISYKEVMETEQGLKTWLEMIYKYGLAILKDVPCEKGEVIKVIERVAYIKKTKWGSSFDVLCEPVQNDPNHLAYTGMYLEHHTDMNYLEKSPGLQALHCLKANPSSDSDSIGGQSFFVDGFYIAKWLRKEHPASFHVLTSTLVEFKIYSHNMEYCNNQYVLCVSKTGEMQEVHYNTRTMAPLKGPADAVQPFYEAYQLMGQKMREKESEFAFNLIPGDLVAFNNRRVLHGRTSFDPRRMSRHLEGCYGDIDEIITRYRSFLKSEKP